MPLRLPLPREPDPVLTNDELDFIAERLQHYIKWANAERSVKLVSNSVIRGQMTARDALAKINLARGRTP